MKKSKLSQKLILITLVCLMMSGLTVGVLGDITEKVRPIEEWGEVNPGLGAWLVWPRAFFSNDWYGDFADPDTIYDGFILEKENSDGSLEVKVNLHVKNLPAGVFEYLKGWVFIFGVVELNFYIQFTMDNGYYGIELPTIDNLFQNYTFGIHGQLKSIHFIAFGSGIYYENGYDPSVEGVPAEVTVKGMGLVKPDIREDHPLRLTFPIIWPGEFIKIHTI